MSTIASPRDPSLQRRVTSQNTPTTSTRPSLDIPRPLVGSPKQAGAPPLHPTKRANRAALREYYHLKKTTGGGSGTATPSLEVTPDPFDNDGPDPASAYSEIAASELDAPDFSAAAYADRALATQGLAELLRTYTRLLAEMRALDAEKKALVYDNYSKLISATETIRRMRATMDPLAPAAGSLDPAIGRIYEQAASIRDALRKEVEAPPDDEEGDQDQRAEKADLERRRARTRVLAVKVVEVPARLRALMRKGRPDDARREWELPRRLLETWKAKGLGGDHVYALLKEGDAIIRGEDGSQDGNR